MRSVGVNMNVPATKGLAELNHHNRDELKQVRNGGGLDGHGLSEEDESRIHEDVRPQSQHQKAQGPIIQWERFLPLRSLKVLLVENDDSTRHVVSALLRNCSYEVTAVANGLEAWKVLIDLNKQIDLVLTEVAMPYLSGIGLLSKITNHVPRKNIPVIMMSSDDSMGIVFNCLSKGAVDFLVKPIRKNELKNLWQHVWRKCHSQSSGSGSESGIRAQKSTESRRNEGSDDVSNSSDEDEDDDDVSIGLTAKVGSDNGSGTQSSWSKRPVEVDSSQAKSSWDKFSNPRDSISDQAIRARPASSNEHGPAKPTTTGHVNKDDKLEAVAMGKDLEIGVPRNSFKTEDGNKKAKGKFCESNPKKVVDKSDMGKLQLGRENAEPRPVATNVILAVTKSGNVTETGAKTNDLLKNINKEDKPKCYPKESPALELSLKRSRDLEDPDTSTQERNVLRQSDLSAFTRYNTLSNLNQAPTGNVGSCSPLGISSEAAKPHNKHSISNGTPRHRSAGSGNEDDMGSTTNNNAFTIANDKTIPNGSTIVIHSATPTLQPLIDGDTVKTIGVHHHHHHYHHYHHRFGKQQMANHDDGSLRNMMSNVMTASAEGNAANYASASGSNNKSNGENGSSGQKGSSLGAVAETGNMGGDNGVADKCKAGDGSGSGSAVDQDRLTQREAALNKFRQKRKERCFDKKVRYQSRKKLAEQRPRLRGQFVRQGVNSNTNEDADS